MAYGFLGFAAVVGARISTPATYLEKWWLLSITIQGPSLRRSLVLSPMLLALPLEQTL